MHAWGGSQTRANPSTGLRGCKHLHACPKHAVAAPYHPQQQPTRSAPKPTLRRGSQWLQSCLSACWESLHNECIILQPKPGSTKLRTSSSCNTWVDCPPACAAAAAVAAAAACAAARGSEHHCSYCSQARLRLLQRCSCWCCGAATAS